MSGRRSFPDARKPAYKLWMDLCDIGIKMSSAQLPVSTEQRSWWVGKFSASRTSRPKQVCRFVSEVLTTGFVIEDGNVILTQPERQVPNVTKLA